VASRCKAVSGSLRQRTQAALCGKCFLIRQSAVWHLPRIASQAKNPAFEWRSAAPNELTEVASVVELHGVCGGS
jgi:hypothetical protein